MKSRGSFFLIEDSSSGMRRNKGLKLSPKPLERLATGYEASIYRLTKMELIACTPQPFNNREGWTARLRGSLVQGGLCDT